uniref:Tyrosine-protein phosphatase domain-containing protein n=1 Tax=Macrostomum lignano TaxID=282301 RepID=A0A1I8JQY2_9PLAT
RHTSPSNKYIVTQWPLRNTICDFWKLVNDHHVAVVVLLILAERQERRDWYGSVYVILQDQFSVGTSIRVRMHTVAKPPPSILSSRQAVAAPASRSGPVTWPSLPGRRQLAGPSSRARFGHGLLELVCLAEETNQAMECTSPHPGCEQKLGVAEFVKSVDPVGSFRLMMIISSALHLPASADSDGRLQPPASSSLHWLSGRETSGTQSPVCSEVRIRSRSPRSLVELQAGTAGQPLVTSSNAAETLSLHQTEPSQELITASLAAARSACCTMTMDKLRFEGEIDIFRAVEKVKRNRPQADRSTRLCFQPDPSGAGLFLLGSAADSARPVASGCSWKAESGGGAARARRRPAEPSCPARVRAARPATLDDFRFPVTSRRNRRRRRRRAADLEGRQAASGEAAAGVEIETETAAMPRCAGSSITGSGLNVKRNCRQPPESNFLAPRSQKSDEASPCCWRGASSMLKLFVKLLRRQPASPESADEDLGAPEI